MILESINKLIVDPVTEYAEIINVDDQYIDSW